MQVILSTWAESCQVLFHLGFSPPKCELPLYRGVHMDRCHGTWELCDAHRGG